jgi:broad specificity phosphatase PhoE
VRPVRQAPENDVADPHCAPGGNNGPRRRRNFRRWADPGDDVHSGPSLRPCQTAERGGAALELSPRGIEGFAESDMGTTASCPVQELRPAAQQRPNWSAAGPLSEPAVDPSAARRRGVDAVEGTPWWLALSHASVSRLSAVHDGRRGLLTLSDTLNDTRGDYGHLRSHR